jgi:hypothetical protein
MQMIKHHHIRHCNGAVGEFAAAQGFGGAADGGGFSKNFHG